MTTAISGYTPTTTKASAGTTGTNAMSSSDFMKVMIAQLQQQDPMNPSSSSDLLTQMSQISQLQSNSDLSTNLKALSLQQSIGAGGNLIGKTVTGIDDTGDKITGNVTSIKVQDKTVYLELDSAKTLPLSNITEIASNSSATANLASSNSTTGTSALSGADLAALYANPTVQALMQSQAGQNYVQNLINGGGSYQSILSNLSSMMQT